MLPHHAKGALDGLSSQKLNVYAGQPVVAEFSTQFAQLFAGDRTVDDVADEVASECLKTYKTAISRHKARSRNAGR